MSRVRATALRVARQLRHDPRTVALLLGVPCMLMTLLRLVYGNDSDFSRSATPLLVIFPLVTMFLVASVSILGERRTGTLERLLTTPLHRSELLAGYGITFAVMAALQATLASLLSLHVLGLQVAGSQLLVIVLAIAVALLGLGLGLLASAFARSEFQVVQFFPALILPQLLLCGLLVPRAQMPAALHALSDALPMSYAVDAVLHVTREASVGGDFWLDFLVVVACAVGAGLAGSATLPRRTE